MAAAGHRAGCARGRGCLWVLCLLLRLDERLGKHLGSRAEQSEVLRAPASPSCLLQPPCAKRLCDPGHPNGCSVPGETKHVWLATSGRSAPKNAPETSRCLAGRHSGAEGRPLTQQGSAAAWHRTHQQLKWKLFPLPPNNSGNRVKTKGSSWWDVSSGAELLTQGSARVWVGSSTALAQRGVGWCARVMSRRTPQHPGPAEPPAAALTFGVSAAGCCS